MLDSLLQQLIKKYHAFYEVSPYYLLVEERLPGAPRMNRRVHAGFDIDLYAITKKQLASSADYELACDSLRKLSENTPRQNGSCSSVEVIPFPTTAVLDARDHFQPHARLKIRVLHYRGLASPAGAAEHTILANIEEQLHQLGAVRR